MSSRFFRVAIILTMSLVSIKTAFANEKYWYYMWGSCANCDSDGHPWNKEANQRLFVSNVVYAGGYDFACKGGAFYDETGMNGNASFGYNTKSEAQRELNKFTKDRERNGWIIHTISLPMHPEGC